MEIIGGLHTNQRWLPCGRLAIRLGVMAREERRGGRDDYRRAP